MAWYLMYLYDPETPDMRTRHMFFALKNIPEEYSKEAVMSAQISAGFVWKGFLSGFAHSNKGKVSDAEVVWRERLKEENVNNVLDEVFEIAEDMKLAVGSESSQPVHDPDCTAEQ